MYGVSKTPKLSALIIRLVVGIIFLSEGIQKFIRPDEVGAGRFTKIGFTHSDFWAHFTGSFEIACATFILLGILTRLAAIPLFVIMVVAFITTKYPMLMEKGFWVFAHEYRTDFAMTLLLIVLIAGAGKKINQ
jgi:uncharacterized membrane protein YphA (DoxX/SURF4 family)